MCSDAQRLLADPSFHSTCVEQRQGACQLTSILKMCLRFGIFVLVWEHFETMAAVCKERIARVSRLLFTQGYVLRVGANPTRASLPAGAGLDSPLA